MSSMDSSSMGGDQDLDKNSHHNNRPRNIFNNPLKRQISHGYDRSKEASPVSGSTLKVIPSVPNIMQRSKSDNTESVTESDTSYNDTATTTTSSSSPFRPTFGKGSFPQLAPVPQFPHVSTPFRKEGKLNLPNIPPVPQFPHVFKRKSLEAKEEQEDEEEIGSEEDDARSVGINLLDDDIDDISYDAAYGRKEEDLYVQQQEELHDSGFVEGFIDNIHIPGCNMEHIPGANIVKNVHIPGAKQMKHVHIPGAKLVKHVVHDIDKGINRGVKGVVHCVQEGFDIVEAGAEGVKNFVVNGGEKKEEEEEQEDEYSDDAYSYNSDDSLFDCRMSLNPELGAAGKLSDFRPRRFAQSTLTEDIYLERRLSVQSAASTAIEENESNSDDDEDCYINDDDCEGEQEFKENVEDDNSEEEDEEKQKEKDDYFERARNAYGFQKLLAVSRQGLDVAKSMKQYKRESGEAVMEDVKAALNSEKIPGSEVKEAEPEISYNEEELFGLAVSPLRRKGSAYREKKSDCAREMKSEIEETPPKEKEDIIHGRADIKRIEACGNAVDGHRYLMQSLVAPPNAFKALLEDYDDLHDEIDITGNKYEGRYASSDSETSDTEAPSDAATRKLRIPLTPAPTSAFSSSNADTTLENKPMVSTLEENELSPDVAQKHPIILCTAIARRTRRMQRIENRPYWNLEDEEDFDPSFHQDEAITTPSKCHVSIKLPSISSFRGLPTLPRPETSSGGDEIMNEASSLAEWLDHSNQNGNNHHPSEESPHGEPQVEFGQPIQMVPKVTREMIVRDMNILEDLLDEQEAEIDVFDEKIMTLHEKNEKTEQQAHALDQDYKYLEAQFPNIKFDIAQAKSHEDTVIVKMEGHITEREGQIEKLSSDIDILKEYIVKLEQSRDEACERAQKMTLERKFETESVWSRKKRNANQIPWLKVKTWSTNQYD